MFEVKGNILTYKKYYICPCVTNYLLILQLSFHHFLRARVWSRELKPIFVCESVSCLVSLWLRWLRQHQRCRAPRQQCYHSVGFLTAVLRQGLDLITNRTLAIRVRHHRRTRREELQTKPNDTRNRR